VVESDALVPIPAQRVWALPFLTVLAPSQRYHEQRNHRHKQLTDWARQMIRQVRRWLPRRTMVVVADSSFAALNCGHCARWAGQCISSLLTFRCSTVSTSTASSLQTNGPPRKVGKRLPGLKALVNNPTLGRQWRWRTGMVGVTIPARHLSNRSLVQNWDASRAHSLGLD